MNLVTMEEVGVMEKVFELEQRKANAMIKSSILPQNFRNIGDVIVLNEMSRNLQIPVILLAQQLYIVKGKVGFSGQFAIALLNKAVELGKLDKWNYEIKGKGVRVVGYKNEDRLEGTWIDEELVAKNGWKSNPHWKNNFDLMAHYRSATWFLRLYYPEMLMGMHSEDEIEDSNTNMPSEIKSVETPSNATIDPLELAKNKKQEEEIKTAEVVEEEEISITSFKELYKELEKEKKAKYMEYTQGVDLGKLSEEELQEFYKEVKSYVGA